MTFRLIPRLDIKGENLVKGIHLEGLRVMGPPKDFARAYYEAGADEIVYMDIVASLYQRNSLLDLVAETSKSVFAPLTVGGGIRSLADIRAALRAGADKVAINTMAVRNPEIISEASRRFGSSTIVVSIEAMRRPNSTYEAYTDNGRERSGREVVAWAKQAAELGAGEILLTSVDREGTGLGFDVALVKSVADAVSIPVIACGGAGNAEHCAAAILDGHADAVSCASILHYDQIAKIVGKADRPGAPLSAKEPPANVKPTALADVKERMRAAGIDVRPAEAARH